MIKENPLFGQYKEGELDEEIADILFENSDHDQASDQYSDKHENELAKAVTDCEWICPIEKQLVVYDLTSFP